MKKIWNKITISIAVGFTVLGVGIGAYVQKKPYTKVEAGVVINGDTFIKTPAVAPAPVDTTSKDTAKLN